MADRLEPALAHPLHHLLKIRPFQVAAGKTLILKNDTPLHIILTEHISNKVFAKLNLIANALTLARELGLA